MFCNFTIQFYQNKIKYFVFNILSMIQFEKISKSEIFSKIKCFSDQIFFKISFIKVLKFSIIFLSFLTKKLFLYIGLQDIVN